MEGVLVKNNEGIWNVKWEDYDSFTHETYWEYTELTPDSNSIRYIKDGQIMYTPFEEGIKVNFEIQINGFDSVNYAPFEFAKLIFPEVDEFEKMRYEAKTRKFEVKLESLDPTATVIKSEQLSMRIVDDPESMINTERLYIHIGECLYRIDKKGFIIERVIPIEK